MPYTSKVSNAGFSVDTNNDGIPDGRAITIKNAGNFNTFSLTNGVLTLQGPTAGATPAGVTNSIQYNDGASSFAGEADFTYNPATNTLNVDNVIIDGNLTVSGTTTTVNTTEITIADNIITLNSDYSGSSPTENAGIKVNRGGGSAPDAEFLWDETNDQWDFDTYALGSVGKVYAAGSNAVYTFTSDTDTGIEHTGLDQLGLLVGNTRVLMVNANGVHIDPTGATGAGSNQALLVDNISIDTNTIASTNTNGNIVIAPNGTGDVQLDADTIRVGDSGATAIITTNGAGDLALDTNGGSDSGSIVIQNGASGDILITPVTSRYVGINQLTPAATLHVDGDAIITGDLTIQGATTQVDSTDTFIKDRLITLNDGESGTGVSGNIAGIEIDRGASGEIARFVWDDNDDFFKVQIEATAGSGSFTDANLKTNQIDAMGNVTIAGNLNVDTNVLSVDTITNRVGINTSPTVALDVSGSAKISSDITVTGDAEFQGKTVANLVQHVTNGNGVSEGALQKGEPVYISGTTAGGQAIVKEADANGSGTYPAIGLVWSDIAFGGTGYIITFGVVEDVPAGVFVGSDPSAGDTVYLSETSAHITVDRPTASGSKVQNIGRITKSNVSVSGGTGTAHILVQGPGRINDIPNDVGDEDIIAAASATNYTPTASTVEGHLAGIDTALAGAGGYTDAEAISAVEGETDLQLTSLTVDTNTLKVDGSNNRVGVGTTSPTETLHVAGNAVISGIQYSQFEDLTDDLAIGWHTIALVEGRSGGTASGTGDSDQRAIGTFLVRNTDSSRHQTVMLTASHLFASGEKSTGISIEHSSWYSTLGITGFRIKENATYDGAVLQINIADATNNIEVYLKNNFQYDGWQLITPVADATDPSSVSLGLGYNNDYSTFTVADTTTITDYASLGQRVVGQLDVGSVTVAGALTVDTNVFHVDVTNDRVGIGTTTPEADLNVVSAATGNIFVLECTDAGAASGPDISLVRDSSSPADDDFLGRIVFKGRDDAGDLLEYGNIKAQLGDASNGSEGFNMFFQGVIAGTNRAMLNLRANDGLAGASQAEVCVNEHGIDMDFRVETDNDTAALFVQGSSDSVGISTTSPVATLDVQSGKTFRVTRLLTVSLSSTTTLNEASHGGRYVFVTGSSTTINLPGTHAAGLHFTLLSNDANGFTLASTDNMNGSASNITVDARNGVTCISDGTDWVVLGA